MREPNIWKNKDNFYLKVLEEPWYGLLVKLENLITFETMKFYEKNGFQPFGDIYDEEGCPHQMMEKKL